MLTCNLDLSKTCKYAVLRCPGVGEFKVFSGDKAFRNKIECSHIPNSTIPPGSYWVADRPQGGILSKIKAK